MRRAAWETSEVIVTGNNVFASLALVAALLAVAACGTDSQDRAVAAIPDQMSDRAGTEPLRGIVRLKSVERTPEGGVRYVVENISGRDQEELAYFVSFFFPSQEDTAIKKLGDRDTTPQRDLVLLRGTEREITAANPRPGAPCLGTTIDVLNNEAVPVVTRGDTPGTLFLNKSLECVAMSTEDDLRDSKLWIEFENVSRRAISELEAKVQFHDPGAANRKVGETKWTPVRDIQPGQRGRVQFDVASLGRLSNTIFLVKIRQQAL